MAYERPKNLHMPNWWKEEVKVIEFPRNPGAKQIVAYCSNCKKHFPGGYNFNYCPDCGRALMRKQQ